MVGAMKVTVVMMGMKLVGTAILMGMIVHGDTMVAMMVTKIMAIAVVMVL